MDKKSEKTNDKEAELDTEGKEQEVVEEVENEDPVTVQESKPKSRKSGLIIVIVLCLMCELK
ncbi:MAG: hypothetical protein PHS44_05400 [Candidatus Dojkabacteria bacterium]|nr:hypothetical protein [Candidatus Dojkabacteria bacterium]